MTHSGQEQTVTSTTWRCAGRAGRRRAYFRRVVALRRAWAFHPDFREAAKAKCRRSLDDLLRSRAVPERFQRRQAGHSWLQSPQLAIPLWDKPLKRNVVEPDHPTPLPPAIPDGAGDFVIRSEPEESCIQTRWPPDLPFVTPQQAQDLPDRRVSRQRECWDHHETPIFRADA